MTAVELRSLTRKELAQFAKRGRIVGWHGMKKDELVRALLNHQRKERRRQRSRSVAADGFPHKANGTAPHAATGRQPLTGASPPRGPACANGGRNLDLSARYRQANGHAADRLDAKAKDAYWIHVEWAITPDAVARAEAALGVDWHRAVPILRLFDATPGEGAGPDHRTLLRDVEIHGNVDHWYVPVDSPGRTYRLQVGYRTPSGRFFALARSQAIRMPRPGANGAVDRTWKRDTRRGRIPERFHRAAQGTARSAASLQNGGNGNSASPRPFPFHVDAELIVHGSTHPEAALTLLGEPVQLSKDGRFSLRFALPDGRQVIPAVTITPSGEEQHTIVLAVERNTRELDPQRTDEPL